MVATSGLGAGEAGMWVEVGADAATDFLLVTLHCAMVEIAWVGVLTESRLLAVSDALSLVLL